MAGVQDKLTPLYVQFDRVRKKQKTTQGQTLDQVDSLIAQIQNFKSTITAETVPSVSNLYEGVVKSNKANKPDYKNYYVMLQKLQKSMDQNLEPKMDKAAFKDVVMPKEDLNDMIGTHLLRSGDFEIYDTFIEEQKELRQKEEDLNSMSKEDSITNHHNGDENNNNNNSSSKEQNRRRSRDKGKEKESSGERMEVEAPEEDGEDPNKMDTRVSLSSSNKSENMEVEEDLESTSDPNNNNNLIFSNSPSIYKNPRQAYEDLWLISKQIQDHCNILPAEHWAHSHHAQLSSLSLHLPLLYSLYSFQFLLHLHHSSPLLSIAYARSKFPIFHSTPFFPKVQRLLSLLAFHSNPISPPPTTLLLEFTPYSLSTLTSSTLSSFLHSWLQIMSLPKISVLQTLVDRGGSGMKGMWKMVKVMEMQGRKWGEGEGIWEGEEGGEEEEGWHSVLVCPVSREVCGEGNPGMMLVCGHVIGRESLNKIGANNRRFKCPYCPVEQKSQNAVQVRF
eukprot:TRINITY_DN874_c0_g1_i1.p1 TRINITY_DN874_c0_g1~~TRINITY_DN874_c0_g1_i1.p1  ORF type:complete len:503 (-),score=152.72 TRINITY_DN874_c0_g1_i1:90-1598(-)